MLQLLFLIVQQDLTQPMDGIDLSYLIHILTPNPLEA